ncbi:MAG TPA: OmpA family protein [Thermoanaerobaculia bacterium]|nr:OmpA family protein [Thermoanaerobaculia bacterium]
MSRVLRVALILVFLGSSIGVLVGCAGLEVLPDGRWVPPELPAADRAVAAAKKAGKDKQCPDEFKAAEKLQKDAWPVYNSCRTKEAIAMAKDAVAKVNALCPPKAAAPAPAPMVPPAPTIISFSASPASVDQGKCATLSWSSVNAKSAEIDHGVGSVEAGDGSKQVCPSSTTTYTLTATGAGGSKTSSTTVTVNAAAPAVVDKLTVHVNFDTNKSTIRKSDVPELKKALAFANKYPGSTIEVDGYTDSTGSDKYNMGLSERRAAAVKEYLLANGVTSKDKITSRGFGKANPIASNDTADGRFQNRRVEILILSK